MHHDAGERPFIVIWEVTRACQLVCTHCRADAIRSRNPFELSTEQGYKLLDDLASFGTPRPLVVLTGGDPFERPDLPELVAHGGLSMALSPSVTPRLTREVLVELHDAGAKAVSLSLDGASAATHDAFRGVTGVFDDTMDAARMVRDVGYRLQINTTVTRDTVHELPGILKTVLELGTTLWSVFFLVPTGRGKLLNALTAEDEEEVLHWLHDVSDLVAIKTTEAPHYRRIALQRAGVDNLDSAFPVGPLRAALRETTACLLTGDEPRRRMPRPPVAGSPSSTMSGSSIRAGSCPSPSAPCTIAPSRRSIGRRSYSRSCVLPIYSAAGAVTANSAPSAAAPGRTPTRSPGIPWPRTPAATTSPLPASSPRRFRSGRLPPPPSQIRRTFSRFQPETVPWGNRMRKSPSNSTGGATHSRW